ncbi:hypothetical protein RKD30_006522 [Streptomyces pristinaespiralis]
MRHPPHLAVAPPGVLPAPGGIALRRFTYPRKESPRRDRTAPRFRSLGWERSHCEAVCTRLLDQRNVPTPDSPTRGHVTP